MTDKVWRTESKRYLYIDLIKIVALFFMPIVHVFEEFSIFEIVSPQLDTSSFAKFVDIMYCVGPTMFMMCMGASMVLTRHDRPEDFLKRGEKLVLYFFLLNFIRFTALGVGAKVVLNDDELFAAGILWTFASDILMFAGLTFIAMYFVKKHSVDAKIVVLIAAVLCVLQSLVPMATVGDGLLENLAAYVVGNFCYVVHDHSVFPFMGWFIFPALGYWYGTYVLEPENSAARHRILAVASFAVAAAILAFAALGLYGFDFLWWASNGYEMPLLSVIFSLSLCMLVMSLLYLLLNNVVLPEDNVAYEIAREINGIYCAQWIVIMWGLIAPAFIFELTVDNAFVLVLLGVAVFFVSLLIAKLYRRRKEAKTVVAQPE